MGHNTQSGDAVDGLADSALDPFTGFIHMLSATHCPYARRAHTVLVDEPYKRPSPAFVERFRSYEPLLASERTDALVIAVPPSELGASLVDHARTFRGVIEELSGMRISAKVLKPGWQLTVGGVRSFATLFSPLYPADNPRAISVGAYAFVMLQPEHSFHRWLPRARLDTDKRTSIKSSIRDAFERAGQPYDPLDWTPPTEAQKYVKPLRLGDPAIPWWDSPAASRHDEVRQG